MSHTNGHQRNGTGNRNFRSPYEPLKWQVGLMNSENRYLTAEPFGFKLNVSGLGLKKRQLWVLVPDAKQEVVYLKSHLNRYLSADKDGLVSCLTDKPGDEERFVIHYHPDGSGSWSFQNQKSGYYFAGTADMLSCFSKTPVWWSVRLAVHPQVHMRNLNRQRYARLRDDQLVGDQTAPWGADSLITLQQHQNGRVAVRTRDNRFLQCDGELVDDCDESTLYSLEVKCGVNTGFALKDSQGRYLTHVGTGETKCRQKTVTRDELFILEDSNAQVAILSFNGKYASIKQGVDIYANQLEANKTETFQLEFQPANGKWCFRTCDDKLMKVDENTNGLSATGNNQDQNTQFQMEYLAEGRVALRANNGSYVSARKLGAMYASGDTTQTTPSVEETLTLIILNRPIVVFRGDNGFVGFRAGGTLECNLANHAPFHLEHVENGKYLFKSESGEYWSLSADGSIVASSGTSSSGAAQWRLEFRSRTHAAILSASCGRYLRGEQNGTVRVDASEPDSNCLWEY